ncbi:MAG: alpha/beta hydrolase [Albidovulum sp.]|nr:alpha/beta hydrolase [Albidovulum sp.]MDE0533348.1 alpha/beta hydrolase [Albidovulum sp.]
MILESAPLFSEIAESPVGGTAFWLKSKDGARIRLAVWDNGDKGTVLLFPGRTEYIEKYGNAAREIQRRGYSFAVIDWRGHGLSDRQCADRSVCHVGSFLEYQRDVHAARQALSNFGVPQPVFLLAHSMGGCIGLRSLHDGIDVRAAAFSGPMWRIFFGRAFPRIAHSIAKTAVGMGLSKKYVLGTNRKNYFHIASPDKNDLTSDDEMFLFLKNQIETRSELSLGGPSYGWLSAAIGESRSLMEIEPPPYPALILLGTEERIVDPKAIRGLHAKWSTCELVNIQGGRHELMMEASHIRQEFFDRVAVFFDRHLE